MGSNIQVENYLTALPDSSRAICEKLHALTVKCMPGAFQMIAHGALGYATSPSSFDRIVYIAPQTNWVNLGFFFGSDIPDAHKLLAGNGARMRHIKIRELSEVDNPAIKAILKAAWKKAPLDMEKIHKRKK